MKATTLTVLLAICCSTVSSQTNWTLNECIKHAIEHNLSIKQKEAAKDESEVQLNTAKWSRMPNLSGNVGHTLNYGRALQDDNTYGNRNTRNTDMSLSTNVPLFTGMRIPNDIALRKLNLNAAIEDLNKAKDDISLQVASQFLQVLYNRELAEVARTQVQLSKEQLVMKQGFHENGKASEAEVLEASSRVAQDELSATQADNNLHLALLDLTQLLELDQPDGFDIVAPTPEQLDQIQTSTLSTPADIFASAILSKPAIKAAQYRLAGAKHNIHIAQSALYPQLYVGAGMGSSYYHLSGIEMPDFSSQWHRNFNKYIGISLSIPLFNRFETRNQIRSARIQHNAMQWQLEESKKTLYKDIQQAYYNAIAAQAALGSSRRATDAAAASFTLIKEKYANGLATATQYNEARANWMKAISENLQARYDFVFRCLILDFYNGKTLQL